MVAASPEQVPVSSDEVENQHFSSGIVLESEIDGGNISINPEYLRGSSSDNNLGRGHREKRPPSWHRNYVTHTINTENIDPSTTNIDPPQSHSSGKPFPIACHVEYNNFSNRHRCFLATITKVKESSSFKEAVIDVGWHKAMQDEIDALERNGTWSVVDLPPGKRAIGSGWVYKIKYTDKSKVERLKARLVVYGNRQVEGVDYNETFAPVAKMTMVRILLAVVVSLNWELH
ncbi:uncharacterized protein LOC110694594 [Chenopodium quinoa]|uniref:uncharacterized protein LOC110694594 n=1 Tax=Chenopodium quinoa TaxID=63459 RepID=UPI000B78B61D|nr:uncharacterized protein LOC110694594 [Chenopodium quinoa]